MPHLPSAPGPQSFPQRKTRFSAAARHMATPEGRATLNEAAWPALATEILELSLEPQRVLVGDDILDLEMRCKLAGFDVGDLALQALRLAWTKKLSRSSEEMTASVWQSIAERHLLPLSLTDAEPARLAKNAPGRDWASHATILVSEPKDAAPEGVRRGRAE